ncbi:MAG: hypothetical protein AAF499_19350 [Pseudomonadota bacterium]
MGAPSSRAVKRTRPKIPAATFRPGIRKLYDEQQSSEADPDAALDRWSKVGGGPDATFKPHIGDVYRELEESGALRVDSIESRVRWEQMTAAAAGEAESDSATGPFGALIDAVRTWANKKS